VQDENKQAEAQGFLWATPKGHCGHGRWPGRCTECKVEEQLAEQQAINALLRKEKAVYEESSRHWKHLAQYAYQRSSEALMIPPQRAGEARDARDNALCDINKTLGGAIR
jgi:predicted ATP-dependent serine protease